MILLWIDNKIWCRTAHFSVRLLIFQKQNNRDTENRRTYVSRKSFNCLEKQKEEPVEGLPPGFFLRIYFLVSS